MLHSGRNTYPILVVQVFFFSSRRRHTRFDCDWSSDVCSSDLRRSLAASSGQLSRLGLHAGFGDRRGARQRARSRGSGARGSGIHLAGARRRLPSRHGPAPPRPLCLGARGRRQEVKLRGLYAITPEAAESVALLAMLQDALEGGAALVQYRRKKRDVLEAKEVVRLARRHGVPVIVNDDIELALEVSADGAHLGRKDGDLRAARARLAGRILGASCDDRPGRAQAAVGGGLEYVAFGSVFASPTKPGAARAAHSLFTKARNLGVPLAAIGGITLENADRKSTRLNSSHSQISYAVFCLKKKTTKSHRSDTALTPRHP